MMHCSCFLACLQILMRNNSLWWERVVSEVFWLNFDWFPSIWLLHRKFVESVLIFLRHNQKENQVIHLHGLLVFLLFVVIQKKIQLTVKYTHWLYYFYENSKYGMTLVRVKRRKTACCWS